VRSGLRQSRTKTVRDEESSAHALKGVAHSARQTTLSNIASRLLKEILQLALLLFGGTLTLVRASLSLLGVVAGHGAGGFFGPALDLIHRPFALVLSAALSAHSTFLSSRLRCHSGRLRFPDHPSGSSVALSLWSCLRIFSITGLSFRYPALRLAPGGLKELQNYDDQEDDDQDSDDPLQHTSPPL
jgi:hypothetical protein